MQQKSFLKTLGAAVREKLSRSHKRTNWEQEWHKLRDAYLTQKARIAVLDYGNQKLKQQNNAILKQKDESQIKEDLNEAINLIVDYQKTLFRAALPDPNVQRANDLFNKWGLRSERVHGQYKIYNNGQDITMGREY